MYTYNKHRRTLDMIFILIYIMFFDIVLIFWINKIILFNLRIATN